MPVRYVITLGIQHCKDPLRYWSCLHTDRLQIVLCFHRHISTSKCRRKEREEDSQHEKPGTWRSRFLLWWQGNSASGGSLCLPSVQIGICLWPRSTYWSNWIDLLSTYYVAGTGPTAEDMPWTRQTWSLLSVNGVSRVGIYEWTHTMQCNIIGHLNQAVKEIQLIKYNLLTSRYIFVYGPQLYCSLYSFLRNDVTVDPKMGVLKEFIITFLEARCPKSRFWHHCVFSEVSKEESFSSLHVSSVAQ